MQALKAQDFNLKHNKSMKKQQRNQIHDKDGAKEINRPLFHLSALVGLQKGPAVAPTLFQHRTQKEICNKRPTLATVANGHFFTNNCPTEPVDTAMCMETIGHASSNLFHN